MRIMGNKLILVATAVAFFGYSWRRGKLNEYVIGPAGRAVVGSGTDVSARVTCNAGLMYAVDRVPRIGLSNDLSAAA